MNLGSTHAAGAFHVRDLVLTLIAPACYTPSMRRKILFPGRATTGHGNTDSNTGKTQHERRSNRKGCEPGKLTQPTAVGRFDALIAQVEQISSALREQESAATLGDALGCYFDERYARWATETRVKYDRVRIELAEVLGSLRLTDARRLHGLELVAQAPNPSAARDRLTMATAAWHAAVRHELTTRPCPWRGIKPPPAGMRDRYLTEAELRAVWHGIDDAEAQGASAGACRALRLLIWVPLRSSEACLLRVADIDWQRKVLRLQQSKTGKRDVPVGSPALAFLRAESLRGPWVCPDSNGRPVNRRTVWGVLMGIYAACGIAGANVHTLRHTWITHALIAGRPLEEIRKISGHSTAGMAVRYGHLSERHIQAAAEDVTARLGRILK